MKRDEYRQMLQEKLERCRRLCRDFPDGPTGKHIREIEAELLNNIRALDAEE